MQNKRILLALSVPIFAYADVIGGLGRAIAVPLIFVVGISLAILVLLLMRKYFNIGTITRPLMVSMMFILILFMNIGFIINDYFSYTGVEAKSLIGIIFPIVLAAVFYRWHKKTLTEQ